MTNEEREMRQQAGGAIRAARNHRRSEREQYAIRRVVALSMAIRRYRAKFARDSSELNHLRCVWALTHLRAMVRSWQAQRGLS